jgi:hypothetical protein
MESGYKSKLAEQLPLEAITPFLFVCRLSKFLKPGKSFGSLKTQKSLKSSVLTSISTKIKLPERFYNVPL